MKKYLESLPEQIKEIIRISSEISAKNGVHAYLVGGFVRDLILGVPNFDLDIVVEEDGIKFAEELALCLCAKLIRHKRFGTATIILKHHFKIDITTARKEHYPHPASLPVVSAGSLSDDLFRRDFTINALAIKISKDEFGRFVDLFDGRKDLANKKIRILHDLSFIDDPTRILRAIRFKERYNFSFEKNTGMLLKASAKKKMLEKVEPQRLRDEIILMLKEREPSKHMRSLERNAGLGFINSRLKLSKGILSSFVSLKKELAWFNLKFPHHRQIDAWLVYLTILTEKLPLAEMKSLLKKFVFRKGEEKRILVYRDIKNKVARALSLKSICPSKAYHLLEPLSYEAILLIRAKSRNKLLRKHIEDFFGIYNGTRIHVNGDDLRSLGIKPGPLYQKVFRKVLDAKLDGKVSNHAQEMELVKSLIVTN